VAIIIQVDPNTEGFEVFKRLPLAVADAPVPKLILITVSVPTGVINNPHHLL
jgi:hypothetical protein